MSKNRTDLEKPIKLSEGLHWTVVPSKEKRRKWKKK